MELILLGLINGEKEILEYFQNANDLWEEIWDSKKSEDEKELADLITSYQHYFDVKCGGPLLSQEIIAWSAYAYLLKIGKGKSNEKLERLNNAFEKSHLSNEIYADIKKSQSILLTEIEE